MHQRMLATKPDYRERLYGSYVQTHMARIRDITLDGVRRDFPILRKTVAPFLPTDKNAKILDIGCGFGSLVLFLRENGCRNVEGIDNSPQMMEVASRLGIDGVSKSDIFSYLEDVSGRYGMIVALDVIEHFRKDEIFAILDLVHQALRAGGLFLMQTPNGMSKYGRWYRTYDFTHETIFDAESARQCLSAIGFRNVVIKPVPPVVHGMPSAVRAVLWRFWEPMLKL